MAKEHEKPIEETVDDKEPEKEGKGPQAPVSAGLQSAEMLGALGQ